MIQKLFITSLLIFIFLFFIRFLKKLKSFNFSKSKQKKNDETVIDLEKDPKTNEYKPKK